MTDDPPTRIYAANKIENRITFETKKRYYLKFLTPETMKLLGSTKRNKVNNNENRENEFSFKSY